MAKTPYGLRAEKNGRRIIRRYETQQATDEALAALKAEGWDAEEDAPIDDYAERKRQEQAAQTYALEEKRQRVRLYQ